MQLTEWSLRGIWLSNGPFLILSKLKEVQFGEGDNRKELTPLCIIMYCTNSIVREVTL